MCWRWAEVSVASPGAEDAPEGAGLEQAASARAIARQAEAPLGEWLFVMHVLWVDPRRTVVAPPAAAERLEQSRRVGETAGLGLHEADLGLLIALLGGEQRRAGDVAVLQLPLGPVEA